MVELQDRYRELKSLGVEVIAISVDDRAGAEMAVEELGLKYPVLYDSDFAVTRSWGIFDLLDDGVAAPATYLFDKAGKLIAYRVGEHIADRPAAGEVVTVFKAADAE